jgi:hypothetical protein
LWALYRLDVANNNESTENYHKDIIHKYKAAIKKEDKMIYFLFLDISIDTMKRRRRFRKDDLPMDNEDQDCLSLHQALSLRALEIFPTITSDLDNIEFQVFDNNADDKEDIIVKNIFDWLLHKRISQIK